MIIGGRIGYVLLYNPLYFFNNPIEIIKVWNGGMAFHGGLIGVIISTAFFSIKRKINFYLFTDLLACAAPIGIFLGRIANFINGELVGRITNEKIGIIFRHIDDFPRHASQIYEAFFEGLVIFIILIFLIRKNFINNRFGINTSIFLITYGIFRFFLEYLREPDAHIGLVLFNLSMGQLISVIVFFVGIFLWKSKKNV